MHEGHVAVEVCTKNACAEALKSTHHLLVRVTKRIVETHTDNRPPRTDRLEPADGGGSPRSMMRNLQYIHGRQGPLPNQHFLGLDLDVASEQIVAAKIRQPGHERPIVFRERITSGVARGDDLQ